MGSRGNFGSRFAGILVAAGSAVGLGNIWRFPYELGRNGGAAFLIIYILCILAFGLPLMISEFAVGRHAQSNSARAFGRMGGSKHWKWVGFLGVLTGTLILCYYGVAAGWTVEYLFEAGVNGFAGKTSEQFATDFSTFISDPMRPVACMIVFMLINLAVILAGVKGGIERGSKLMMPLLFVFVLVLAFGSVFLIDSKEGLVFLFKPDFSKVTSGTLLAAMGQAFYSLSLSMGCLCTYASYFRKEDKLVGNAINVATIDTFIAILAGLIIFPAAFSAGIEPGAGPSLVFITLPYVFQQVFTGQPVLCYIFSLMFYLLLVLATLTSAMGLLEVPTIYLKEEFRIRRRWSAIGCTLFCIIIGVGCSLSMGKWSGFTIGGLGLFDLFDFVTAKIMLPVGGLLTALYVGYFCDNSQLRDEITNHGTVAVGFYKVYIFLVRFVAPLAIIAIFLNQFGLL
ncbi:MAG: sodium-dependent transporter [Prevotellaceae bacterium]|nr:sodium-dependent transporter [Prevotellaceae bacterium]